MKVKQINNLEIHRIINAGGLSINPVIPYLYQVRTQDKRILEEFTTYGNAVICAKSILDFTNKRGIYEKI